MDTANDAASVTSLIEFAAKVSNQLVLFRKNWSKANDDLNAIVKSVDDLKSIIEEFEAEFLAQPNAGQDDDGTARISEDERYKFVRIMQDCRSTFCHLETLCNYYQDISTNTKKKARWSVYGQTDFGKLAQRVDDHKTTLQAKLIFELLIGYVFVIDVSTSLKLIILSAAKRFKGQLEHQKELATCTSTVEELNDELKKISSRFQVLEDKLSLAPTSGDVAIQIEGARDMIQAMLEQIPTKILEDEKEVNARTIECMDSIADLLSALTESEADRQQQESQPYSSTYRSNPVHAPTTVNTYNVFVPLVTGMSPPPVQMGRFYFPNRGKVFHERKGGEGKPLHEASVGRFERTVIDTAASVSPSLLASEAQPSPETSRSSKCKGKAAEVKSNLQEYFVPRSGIAESVINRDTRRYLGDDATVRTTRAGSPLGDGYIVTARRALTTDEIGDMKANSRKQWDEVAQQYRERFKSVLQAEDSNEAVLFCIFKSIFETDCSGKFQQPCTDTFCEQWAAQESLVSFLQCRV